MNACAKAGIEPLIAMNRDSHHPSLSERFAPAAHRLKTPEGKKLYALRKCMPEPVFGIIKSVLGFRQFLLRGLESWKEDFWVIRLTRW